ncbi:MAG: S41 family peptidase, partial [Planctomycetota bacterium]
WDLFERQFAAKANAAASPTEFVDAILPMLRELEDLHVRVELAGGVQIPTYVSPYQRNSNSQQLRKSLDDLRVIERVGFVGRSGRFLVVAVEGLPAEGDYAKLIGRIRSAKDVDGVVMDLRDNRGGSESRAAEIAGLFAADPIMYARTKRRVAGELRETSPRYLQPSLPTIELPVVCLIGPGCVSSGEGMALMFKALTRAVVIGQPTRGASGNPAPVTLANGVKVWFSRWQSLETDGRLIEEKGVTPDELFEQESPGDPTFQRAIAILNGLADRVDHG